MTNTLKYQGRQLPEAEDDALQAAAQAYVDAILVAARRAGDIRHLETATESDVAGSAVSAALQGVCFSREGEMLSATGLPFTIGVAASAVYIETKAIHPSEFMRVMLQGFAAGLDNAGLGIVVEHSA